MSRAVSGVGARARSQRLRWLMVVCSGLWSCSALLDIDGQQCATDQDCVDAKLGKTCERNVCVVELSSAAAATSGGCMSDMECSSQRPRCLSGACVASDVAARYLCTRQGDDTSSDAVRLHYTVHVIEYRTRMPPKNLIVKACRATDLTCVEPVATASDGDESGLIELDLPIGFVGFFDVKADSVSALSYISKPLTKDLVDRDLQVPSTATIALLSLAANMPVDSSKGMVLIEGFECDGTPAGGVHFTESTGNARPFYIVDSLPNVDAQLTRYDSVANVADGGFLDLDPGFVKLTAELGVGGPELGLFNAYVRAGTVTFVDLYF